MVLRAFLTHAKWDIPVNMEQKLVYCDQEGKLSITAVAGHPNGKEVAEVLKEGVYCEVCSYRMDIEEPQAAGIISRAGNEANELAMRTTELSAVAALKRGDHR